jgi:threonine synthase
MAIREGPIRYFSTNASIFGSDDLESRIVMGRIKTVGLAEAIITGQAPDGGLFMPVRLPHISLEEISEMRDMPYSAIFAKTMSGFFKYVLSDKTLERIAQEAYTFEPFIEKISEKDHIARLDEGPTGAFKDYAAQVLFRVVEALIKEEPESEVEFREKLSDMGLLTYIVATSGDTGGAMGKACLGRDRMWMVILHSADVPGEVSELQAKQMDTLGGNVYVVRVRTDFDGCHALAQDLLKDKELKYMNITSANSINIGRLLPQISYYFYAYARVANIGEEVYVSVPFGNAGNFVAGLFAKKMGLPIKLIGAVNENDVFERFYRTGIYAPAKEALQCPSNAMDVNWPSNMRRLFQLYGGQLVEGKHPFNPRQKVIEKMILPDLRKIREDMVVYSISNRETVEIIREFYNEGHKIVYKEGNKSRKIHSTIEPHGAVAWGAAKKFREDSGYKGKIITFETAHPGKFPETLRKMGIEPELPHCLAELVGKPHGRYSVVDNDYNKVKGLIARLYNTELRRRC